MRSHDHKIVFKSIQCTDMIKVRENSDIRMDVHIYRYVHYVYNIISHGLVMESHPNVTPLRNLRNKSFEFEIHPLENCLLYGYQCLSTRSQ